MCDFCGCPAIDPFSVLTDDHLTLLATGCLPDVLDPLDLDALRVIWEDHRAQEGGATEHLAGVLSLEDVVATGRGIDAGLEALLALPEPDPRQLRFAMTDHVDGYEFEVFPALVLPADRSDLEGAARAAAGARAA